MTIPFANYLNIRWAGGASCRHDGGRVAFLTNITGTAQLWTLDEALGWPEQLTFFEDRLMFASYSPTGDRIAFGKDTGGDEEQLIYLIDDAGGIAERLSPTDAKHLWGGWSHAGDRLAWTHTGRNGRDFDVYVYDLTAGQERCVAERDGYNYVAGWMPDDDALIIGRASSNTDSDLYLLDLSSGDVELLTEHDGEAIFSSPRPLPDGSGFYMLTNHDRDFVNLAFYDLNDGQWSYVDECDWDREQIALSDDGRHLVLLTNEDGYTTIEIRGLGADEGDATAVRGLPRGVYGGARFATDSSLFTIACAAPDDSTDVWRVDAATGQATRWTCSSMAGIPRDQLVCPELVHFRSFDDLEIPAFYYRPADAEPPYPVIIDIHGGPEGQRRPTLTATVQYFLQEGFAVLSPNVRGSSGYGKRYMDLDNVRKRMDSVADIKAAYEWLTTAGGADPGRVGLIGGSYGGFMVLSSMVTYPELWAAGVDIVGIANFVTFLENTSDYRRHLREPEYGSLADDRDFLVEISPLTHIDRIAAPLMVIHGRNDPRVPVGEAEQVVAAVSERGLPVESLIYDDEGHGLAKLKNRLDAYPKVAAFFGEHL